MKRIFGQPEYDFVEPLVLAVFETLERWESCFRPSEMPEEVAIPLREELAAAAYRVERTMRQAKLLAEAALTPIDDAFDASGIGARVRRRIGTVETEVASPARWRAGRRRRPVRRGPGLGWPLRRGGAAHRRGVPGGGGRRDCSRSSGPG